MKKQYSPKLTTEQAMERLEKGLVGLIESGDWSAYLKMQGHFHGYSFGNIMLILTQCPHASRVAGFQTWKQLGRFVKKGEKGIAILAPTIVKVKDEQTEAFLVGEEETTKRKVVGFRVVYIYDVSQTDGDPLPKQPALSELHGNTGWYQTIKQACPLTVTELDDLGGALAKCYHGDNPHIEMLKRLDEKNKASALIHEWGHHLLHPNGEEKSRRIRELEAESTAYVVSQALGFDTSAEAFGYIAGWLRESDQDEMVKKLKRSAARIQVAAHTILEGIERVVKTERPQPLKEAV